jgi:phenylpropionate dioxygenase-like ring-hydroxylating dioxygenase large terminal subunit
MGFVRNAWYVAGWSREFDELPRCVTVLGENLAMYRASGGDVVALHDRCPHKYLPLSRGRVVEDGLQYGYHGLVYAGDGRCVRIPGQPRVPPTLRVRSYPVLEQHGIVWVWTGDPERAAPEAVFELPQQRDPAWFSHQGDALHIRSNYLNVAENLLDPAHVTYVHPTTLGSASHADVPVRCDSSGDPILVWRWIRDAPPIGFFQAYGDFTGNVDRWQYFYLYMPSIAVIDFGSADTALALPEDRRHEGLQVFALHFLTPVTEDYTIDRWMHIRNTRTGDDAVSRQMDDMFRIAFAEDKDILEAVQVEQQQAGGHSSVELAIDQGATAYRVRVARMIAAEGVA